MAWSYAHEFHDGIGETASGVQVNDNFVRVREKVEALEKTSSGFVFGGPTGTLTNTHVAVPGASLTTPAIISGQILLVTIVAFVEASNNIASAALVKDGVEEDVGVMNIWAGTAAPGATPLTNIKRYTGLSGAHTFAANAWASTSAGNCPAVHLLYQVLNA